jgi:hypothetical protein
MKSLRALAAAAVVCTTPCTAMADWVPISADNRVLARDSPRINTDGTRDVIIYGTTREYTTWRYNCASRYFFETFYGGNREILHPIMRDSAAETGYAVACGR